MEHPPLSSVVQSTELPSLSTERHLVFPLKASFALHKGDKKMNSPHLRGIFLLSLCSHRIMQEILVSQADTFFQFYLRFPTHRFSLAHIQEFARRTVRTGSVPKNLTFVTDYLSNLFCQLLDGQFFTSSGIDGLVTAVVVHKEDAQVGQIIYIEEFAQRTAVAPASHAVQRFWECKKGWIYMYIQPFLHKILVFFILLAS